MAFNTVFGLHPLVFIKNNIHSELRRLGVESQVIVTGNSVIYVEFESQDDMNLYKLVGNYKQSSKVKFFCYEA